MTVQQGGTGSAGGLLTIEGHAIDHIPAGERHGRLSEQGPFWFLAKVAFFLFFYVWTRGTLPRFRYDQLMAFGWKLLLPVSLVNLLVTGLVIIWPQLGRHG